MSNWNMMKLGNVAKIQQSTKTMDDDNIWLLNLDMIEQQTGNIVNYLYTSKHEIGNSTIKFDEQNVLYSKLRPNLNKVVCPMKCGYATSELVPLLPNSSLITREYLTLFLRSVFFVDWAVSKTAGAKMPRLSPKELMNKEIPVPPLETQRIISNTIDKLQSIIICRKSQLEKFDELIKARFVEMFGDPVSNDRDWDSEKLEAVCNGVGDGLHGTPEYDDNGEYPFINGNNLMNGVIEITPTTKMVDESTYKKHYIKLSDNAILLSINGTLGKIALYNGEKVMLGKSACYCNLKPHINRVFVWGVMNSNAFKEFLEKNATASTIKNVGLKTIRSFNLILPPVNLQTQFTTFVEQINKSKFHEAV